MATIVTRASKGSALTWTEADNNITNLNNAKLENVVEDTTPQLGGNLDVNGNSIVSAANGNISITPNGTGSVVIDGNTFPQTQGAQGQILVADGGGLLEWANQEKLTAYVYNADSVTINKGEPVYVFSAQGDQISVKRALNTADATSAQTLGLAAANIAATASGVVICQGVLTNVDTSTYTAGQALYLGATAGSVTTTKPSEPNHLVYLGFVEKVNASSGRIYVRVQNGYELAEIHDVNINNAVAIADNHYLRYNLANDRWQNSALDIINDTTPQLGGSLDVNGNSIVSASNGNINIVPNGTGNINLTPATGKVTISAVSFPTGTGTNGQVLTSDGAGNSSWSTPAVVYPVISDDTTTNSTHYLVFDDVTSGNASTVKVSSTKLTFNPSTGALTATSFVGSLTGNASTATTATNASNINIASTDGNTGDTTMSVVLVGAQATGNQQPHIDAGLTYNATTNALTATQFVGALDGIVGSVTPAAGTFTTLTVNAANDLRLADSDSSNYIALKAPTTVGSNVTYTLPGTDGTAGWVLSTSGSGTLSWVPVTSGVTITDDTTTNATRYILFDDSTSGSQSTLNVSSTKLTFNPSTGALTATSFVGSLTGNASTATTATTATNANNININTTDGNAGDTTTYLVLVGSLATGNQTPHIDSGLSYNATTNALTATQFVGGHDGIVGSVTPAAGTFTTLTANTSASLKAINEGALYDLGTTGGTIAPNVANGNVQKITLNAALTINAFTSPVAGQTLTLIIYGGTAYTSITSTMKFAGGIKTLTGTAGCIDILSVYYDGTNYFASLGKGFA